MFCPNCGSKISDNQKFCMQCGKPISVNASPTREKIRQKKSPVLAILLVLTIIMTAVTARYFLFYNDVINTSDISPDSDAVTDVASIDVKEDADVDVDPDDGKDTELRSAQEKVESEFDTVSNTLKAPLNVADGGDRQKLPSGETICTLKDGSKARNVWVKHDDGKLYYFAYDGCMVLNNYAPDGFYASDDGSFDDSVPKIDGSFGQPLLNTTYISEDSGDPVIFFEKSTDNTYECFFIKRYSFGYEETFGVMADPNSSHAYLLDPEKSGTQSFDECKGPLMTILDDGKTLIVSDCGITDTYYAK